MRSRGFAWVLLFALSTVVVGVLADEASASTPGHFSPPMAGLFDFLNPVKNLAELVGQIVGKLFGALAKALMPDFLRDASVRTLQGLVALPNLSDRSQWRNVGALLTGTTALAWALLPLPFTIAALRYVVGTFTDGPHPLMAVWRAGGAALGLVLYPWAAGQAFAFVNVLTHSLLALPAVGNGLQRAVGVLFGAAIIAGLASPFLACLALVAIVLGTLLFGLKIAVLMIAALLYVTGPLVIALAALHETSHLYRAWLFAFIALALIPVGWCLIFAVSGALTLDATSGGVSGKLLGKNATAALAAILSFAIAVMWPKVLIGHALQVAAGMGIRLRGVGGGATRAPVPGRAQGAMRQLRDGATTMGRGVGRAMGQLGAPAGGAAGWAGRLMLRSTPGAAVAGAAAGAATRLGARVSSIRGRAADPSAGRFTRAADELAALPTQMRNGRRADPAATAAEAPDAGRVAARTAAASPAPADSRRGQQLDPEKRAVLARLPRDVPPRVREAVVRSQPGRAADTAARAAARAGAPLSPAVRRAVYAASASASQRTPGADVRPSTASSPRPSPQPASARAPRSPQRPPQAPAPRVGRSSIPSGRRPRKPRGGRRS